MCMQVSYALAGGQRPGSESQPSPSTRFRRNSGHRAWLKLPFLAEPFPLTPSCQHLKSQAWLSRGLRCRWSP